MLCAELGSCVALQFGQLSRQVLKDVKDEQNFDNGDEESGEQRKNRKTLFLKCYWYHYVIL